jgi:hypothetical protein
MMNTPEKGQLCCNLHGVLSFPLPGKPIPAMIQYHDSSGYYSEKAVPKILHHLLANYICLQRSV